MQVYLNSSIPFLAGARVAVTHFCCVWILLGRKIMLSFFLCDFVGKNRVGFFYSLLDVFTFLM